jgi:thiol-disulfide isomerase/thioredoxin
MKKKIVLFYSSSCEPCKFQKPLVESVAKEYKIPLELIAVDNEEAFNFAKSFGVKGWPYVLFIADDIVKEQMIGYDTTSPENNNKNRLLKTLKEIKFID